VAEGGRCPLDPVQSAEMPLGHVRVLPDPVERFGGQIVQHRAAVEQERLTQDRRDPGVDILLDLIAPATKHMRHLLLRVVDAIFANTRQASGRRWKRCWLFASLPWSQRPRAAALLAAVAGPQRPFDAIVVEEFERAFSAGQFE
jgi:hypothetical protein